MVCTSESAIDAYLLFGLAEAKALIEQTPGGGLGDRRAADGRAHPEFRADRHHHRRGARTCAADRLGWVLENAAEFTAGLEN
jgi:hypothetical protein